MTMWRKAVGIVLLAAGLALLGDTGLQIVAERNVWITQGSDGERLSLMVMLKLLLGAALFLLAGSRLSGTFSPVRAVDVTEKTAWESLHERPSFRSFHSRAAHMQPAMASLLHAAAKPPFLLAESPIG
eukprot:GHVU01219381.1.p1 GENE.GHVU01219381.1~~GHVU01219381.1.p1  ORF type:complete len:128 (+),score=21.70 GHVU01219381.1:426-809(+)